MTSLTLKRIISWRQATGLTKSLRICAILITSSDQITPDWLTRRLREGGFLPYFRVRDIRLLETRESDAATIHTLRVRFSDISVTRTLPDTAVLKVSHAGHPLADREVTFYERLLPELRQTYGDKELSICSCYDSHYDIDADQSHVLLAGLPDSFQGPLEANPPSRRNFAQLADALARIHACFWEDERLGHTLGIALSDAQLDEKLAQQRDGLERFLADRMILLDTAQQAALDSVAGKMPVEYRERRLSGRHKTIIHGNLEPANLRHSHRDCRILDWKHWRLGLAAEDLANMIAFHWIPAKRRFEEPRLLQRHWGEMQRCGLRDYSSESFRRDYRIAVGLRLGELIGSWRSEDWRNGRWPRWDAISNGLRAFEELRVNELFSM